MEADKIYVSSTMKSVCDVQIENHIKTCLQLLSETPVFIDFVDQEINHSAFTQVPEESFYVRDYLKSDPLRFRIVINPRDRKIEIFIKIIFMQLQKSIGGHITLSMLEIESLPLSANRIIVDEINKIKENLKSIVCESK